ncbi:MAG TPA: hypothetical protein VN426_12865 [Syntrophomonadaceae bacterium]|nr:hypothetical protein [Syntrophomonadaceae bacterium]
MPLTPEQREAWEREKAERLEREKQQEELVLKKHDEIEKIDRAINTVERQEKRKKILIVAVFVIFYGLMGFWYFFLR